MKAGMWEALKGKTLGVILAVCAIFWLIGIAEILGGVIIGTGIVIGMMITIEKIPGFWWFATRQPGKMIVVIGTAYLAHLLYGGTSLMAMVAMTWALILKVLVIDSVQRRLGMGD